MLWYTPSTTHYPQLRRAFTLVELLVVITIIGILIALLLPAVQAAREAARRMQCSNNLRQLAMALHNYHQQNGIFPPAVQCASSEDPGTTDHMGPNWCIEALPFMDQQALYDSFNLSLPISHVSNRPWRGTVLGVMNCPSDSASREPYVGKSAAEGDNWARGNYGANGGLGFLFPHYPPDCSKESAVGWRDSRFRGVMGANCAVGFDQIRDGSSYTILISEIRVGVSERDRRGCWALGGSPTSAVFGYGSHGGGTNDGNGPNPRTDYADDMAGCGYLRDTSPGAAALLHEGMTCAITPGDYSISGSARSRHPDGVHIALCDGGVHFISDYVNIIGTFLDTEDEDAFWLPTGSVWDRLITSDDGLILSGNDF